MPNIKALDIRKDLVKLGMQTINPLTEISNEKLQNFKEIDAFIQVACQRLGTDNYFFKAL